MNAICLLPCCSSSAVPDSQVDLIEPLGRQASFLSKKCWSRQKDQNRCSHPETIGCELFLPPFGVSIYFHVFRPPVSTWGDDWGISLQSSSSVTDASLERWFEVLFIFPRSCGLQNCPGGIFSSTSGSLGLFPGHYPSFLLELLLCLSSISSFTSKETIFKKTVRSSCPFAFSMFVI